MRMEKHSCQVRIGGEFSLWNKRNIQLVIPKQLKDCIQCHDILTDMDLCVWMLIEGVINHLFVVMLHGACDGNMVLGFCILQQVTLVFCGIQNRKGMVDSLQIDFP